MKLTFNDIKYLVVESVKKILKEQEDNNPTPSIYVGTYGKYNSGSLYGKWVDLTNFSSKQEFLDYCYKTLHADERDAELMFQDYEYIPDIFIGESWIDGRFWDFMKNNPEYNYDIKCAVADHVSDFDEYFNVINDIAVYYGCENMTDVAYQDIEELGLPQNPQYYFDYKSFGRDCSDDGPSEDSGAESIYEEFGVDEDDDYALGEAIIDNIYGGITPELAKQYFNFEKFGNALDSEGTYFPFDGGMIEIR